VPPDRRELVQLGLRAFNERNADQFLPYADEDLDFRPALTLIEGGSYRGHDGFRRFLVDVDDDWEEAQVEATDFRDLGDRVIALGRMAGRGKASGVEVTNEMGWVVDFHDGKIVRWRSFMSHADALREGGA
jgi:ketosteroid isomerase-like protein